MSHVQSDPASPLLHKSLQMSVSCGLYAGGCVSQVQRDPPSPCLHKSSQISAITRKIRKNVFKSFISFGNNSSPDPSFFVVVVTAVVVVTVVRVVVVVSVVVVVVFGLVAVGRVKVELGVEEVEVLGETAVVEEGFSVKASLSGAAGG